MFRFTVAASPLRPLSKVRTSPGPMISWDEGRIRTKPNKNKKGLPVNTGWKNFYSVKHSDYFGSQRRSAAQSINSQAGAQAKRQRERERNSYIARCQSARTRLSVEQLCDCHQLVHETITRHNVEETIKGEKPLCGRQGLMNKRP